MRDDGILHDADCQHRPPARVRRVPPPLYRCPRWCSPNDPCLFCESLPEASEEEQAASLARARAAFAKRGESNA